jgi:predicted nucleotidyltransferase
MTQVKLELLLKELNAGLVELYGSSLCGLYLFGSYARSEQDSELFRKLALRVA